MKLEDIYKFFENPPPTYMCEELAVCYVLYVLLQGESYGTELIQRLETEYPTYRLSDTVLYSTIKFLEDQKAIIGYWKKLEGRGRPRRMYQVSPEWQVQSQVLAKLWLEYTNRSNYGSVGTRLEAIKLKKLTERAENGEHSNYGNAGTILEAVKPKKPTERSENGERISYIETALVYSVWLNISPKKALIGHELEVDIYMSAGRTNDSNVYLLELLSNRSVGSDLNIFLIAPGFVIKGDNTSSLPIDPDIVEIRQTVSFRVTALQKGTNKIYVEIYLGDKFKVKLEAKIQVEEFNKNSFIPKTIITEARPVNQPDFVLSTQIIWKEKNSNFQVQCQFKKMSFSRFHNNKIYKSKTISIHLIEQLVNLLENIIKNVYSDLQEQNYSRFISHAQNLFRHLLPEEIQNNLSNEIPQESTLLILEDQSVIIPWELLHDGQKFLGDRFIIGRWLQELNDTRPYEFPVGAVNIAHYANVEHPQLWANLLEAPGAPPPQLLPEGVLHDSTEAIRGLHLIRYSQPSDAVNRRNAPIPINSTDDTEDIERQMRPAKLNFRRNRPVVTLSYVKTDNPELTALEQTWASAFIRAGCSGFIGSLWAVEPSVEAAFISCFYNRLWAGASLGEAFYTSRQLARAAAPDSLDWLAYVLYGDPMARPYRPVRGDGYAIVEPIGREIDDPLSPGASARFRVSLRRSPPIWHKDRVIEVAENLAFENLQVHIVTYGLQIIPELPITMTRTERGDYLGWFTLVVPTEVTEPSALVQVYFADGMRPIHSLTFSFKIESRREE